jgi:anti-sigma regulatory factor (Ser/Thr protein kinase)
MALPGLRHQARLYAGADELATLAQGFLEPAMAAGDPVLIATEPATCARLRAALAGRGADDTVAYADMAVVGHNPARIIPMWQAFADTHRGRPRLWGIGEPVWAGRTADELVECRQHEALLNLAFADGPHLELLCPYDTATLPADVLDAAARTHPLIGGAQGAPRASAAYAVPRPGTLLAEPLSPPRPVVVEVDFRADDLRALRRLVQRLAHDVGLGVDVGRDLALAVDEAATNTASHGGGRGVLAGWIDGPALVCEIRDGGRITDPLVGRRAPGPHQGGGRGLWIANQLCDLVQVRSCDTGTVVRLHMRFGGPRVRPRP